MSQPRPHQQLSLTVKSEPAREKPAAQNIWDTLRTTGLQIPDDLYFKDFCSADSEVAVQCPAAIVQAVSAGNDGGAGPSADIQYDNAADNDTDETTEPNASRPQWSTADAIKALAVLRNWLECNVVGDSSEFDR